MQENILVYGYKEDKPEKKRILLNVTNAMHGLLSKREKLKEEDL